MFGENDANRVALNPKRDMTTPTEADVEAAALEWLETIRWHVAHGSDIALGALTRRTI